MYQINFSKKASKNLDKIQDPNYSNIKSAIINLAENPRPSGYIKLKNRGNAYRIRVGDYRVIYEIFDRVLVIDIIDVGHRKALYE